jgi:hypothetical protein
MNKMKTLCLIALIFIVPLLGICQSEKKDTSFGVHAGMSVFYTLACTCKIEPQTQNSNLSYIPFVGAAFNASNNVQLFTTFGFRKHSYLETFARDMSPGVSIEEFEYHFNDYMLKAGAGYKIGKGRIKAVPNFSFLAINRRLIKIDELITWYSSSNTTSLENYPAGVPILRYSNSKNSNGKDYRYGMALGLAMNYQLSKNIQVETNVQRGLVPQLDKWTLTSKEGWTKAWAIDIGFRYTFESH